MRYRPTKILRLGRVELGMHLPSLNRPHFDLFVDGDSDVIVHACIESPGSDPVVYLDVSLRDSTAGRLVAGAYWKARWLAWALPRAVPIGPSARERRSPHESVRGPSCG